MELQIKGWVAIYQVEKGEMGKLERQDRDKSRKLPMCFPEESRIYATGDGDSLKVF